MLLSVHRWMVVFVWTIPWSIISRQMLFIQASYSRASFVYLVEYVLLLIFIEVFVG